MTLSNRKPLFLALALTLAAPLAFAQSTTPQEQQSQPTQTTTEAATQSTTTQSQDPAAQPTTTQSTTESTTSTTAPTGTQADATADSGEPQKKNWSDLDVDKNGTLNAAEAASVQSLAKAFTEADANADGELTQDEYKAFLAASGKATPRSGG